MSTANIPLHYSEYREKSFAVFTLQNTIVLQNANMSAVKLYHNIELPLSLWQIFYIFPLQIVVVWDNDLELNLWI